MLNWQNKLRVFDSPRNGYSRWMRHSRIRKPRWLIKVAFLLSFFLSFSLSLSFFLFLYLCFFLTSKRQTDLKQQTLECTRFGRDEKEQKDKFISFSHQSKFNVYCCSWIPLLLQLVSVDSARQLFLTRLNSTESVGTYCRASFASLARSKS